MNYQKKLINAYHPSRIVKSFALASISSRTRPEDPAEKDLVLVGTDGLATAVTRELLMKTFGVSKTQILSLDDWSTSIPISGYFVKYECGFITWCDKEGYELANKTSGPYYNIGVEKITVVNESSDLQQLEITLSNGRVFEQIRKWPLSPSGTATVGLFKYLTDIGLPKDHIFRAICEVSSYHAGDDLETILFLETTLPKKEVFDENVPVKQNC